MYPFKELSENISGSSKEDLTMHSSLIYLMAVNAAVAFAFFGKHRKFGIAITLKTVITAIEITSSTRENPSLYFSLKSLKTKTI